MTSVEAAYRLGVDPKTLLRWSEDGKHPELSRAVVRLPGKNRHRRYLEDGIEAYQRALARSVAS